MSFIEWLQSRLIAHGYAIEQDGALGAETQKALTSFQNAKGLKQGNADKATVDALRQNPGKLVSAGEPATVAAPKETMPPWMAELYRRKGLHEVRNKQELAAWLKAGKALGDPSKLPWCGDAIETSIVKTLPKEVVPANPFFAQAWKDFGNAAKESDVGAIGVIRWSKTSGHVGIVAGYNPKTRRVTLLGGNQSDAITLTTFPLSKFIAFRWPKSFPKKSYPALSGGTAGSMAGTR